MNSLPMRNILYETNRKVQSQFLAQIPKKLQNRFLVGVQAFSFRPLQSINANGRLTSKKRSTGEMRAYRTLRTEKFANIFPRFAANIINEIQGEVRLSLDFSTFGDLQLAYLGLITGKGRTIPIWIKGYTLKPKKNTMVPDLIKGLNSFLEYVDDGSRLIIMADRWFASPKLIRYLCDEDIGFVIRIRSGIKVEVPWDKDNVPIREIAQEDCQVTHADKRLRLVVSKYDKSMKEEEPWYLLTNLSIHTRQQVLNLYKKRFEIEEMFRDLKWIMDYEWHRIQRPDVLENILWFVALGWWVMREVMWNLVVKSRCRKVHAKKKLSIFRNMWEEINRHMWPPELTFCRL